MLIFLKILLRNEHEGINKNSENHFDIFTHTKKMF